MSGTANEVVSSLGLLVWVECCVGFMFCVLSIIRTSSSSLSIKPEGNKQGTCTVSNHNIVFVQDEAKHLKE